MHRYNIKKAKSGYNGRAKSEYNGVSSEKKHMLL